MSVSEIGTWLGRLIRDAGRYGYRIADRARFGGRHQRHWVRVVMDHEIDRLINSLGPTRCDAIEISGTGRKVHAWNSYRSVSYPEFDLLAPRPLGAYDVVICDQVLEHVDDPRTAVATLASLCRPGGHVIVSTPFMLKIHPAPVDNWRFTPTGLSLLLSSAGLRVTHIDSWGNQSCIRANRKRWAAYRPWHRAFPQWALRNDPDLPQVVWAMAERSMEAK